MGGTVQCGWNAHPETEVDLWVGVEEAWRMRRVKGEKLKHPVSESRKVEQRSQPQKCPFFPVAREPAPWGIPLCRSGYRGHCGMGTRTPTPEFQSLHGTAWESHQSAAQWWNRRPTVLEPLRSEELQDWDTKEGTRGLISFSTVYKEAGSQILLWMSYLCW